MSTEEMLVMHSVLAPCFAIMAVFAMLYRVRRAKRQTREGRPVDEPLSNKELWLFLPTALAPFMAGSAAVFGFLI